MSTSRSDPPLAAIDVGGTKVAALVGTSDGVVLASQRWAQDPESPPEAILDPVWTWLAGMESVHGRFGAVGMACPGPLSYVEGKLLAVPNMLRWQGFPVGAWLDSKAAERPHRFMNDANAGILAEVFFGAAKGRRSAAFLTFSTGMGAGLFLDGRLYEGPRALAGEVGHLRLAPDGPVGFGKAGSVEGFCSGPGILQQASSARLAAVQRGDRCGFGPDATVLEVFDAARAGDAIARAVVDGVGRRLGELCAILGDLLDLECIVLGTIAQAHFDLLEAAVRGSFRSEALAPLVSELEIVPSPLANRGGLAALAVARSMLETAARRL